MTIEEIRRVKDYRSRMGCTLVEAKRAVEAGIDLDPNAKFAPDALSLADALAEAAAKALDRMDRGGGDAYGMPECPWCHRDGNIPDGPVDLADYHDADCELLASRAALAAYRTARGTR